jgi:hypothetical protein
MFKLRFRMVKEIFIQRNGPGACGAAQTRFDHFEFEHLLVDVLDTGRPNILPSLGSHSQVTS